MVSICGGIFSTILRNGVVESIGKYICHFGRHEIFLMLLACTILHSYRWYLSAPFPRVLLRACCQTFVFMTVLISEAWCHSEVLFCISFITHEVEKIFLC